MVDDIEMQRIVGQWQLGMGEAELAAKVDGIGIRALEVGAEHLHGGQRLDLFQIAHRDGLGWLQISAEGNPGLA